MSESALWLTHELLLILTCGCFLAIVADGFLRDRKDSRRG